MKNAKPSLSSCFWFETGAFSEHKKLSFNNFFTFIIFANILNIHSDK